MRIEASQIIATQPALMIRELMREGRGPGWTIELVENVLNVNKSTARQIVYELEAEGYIRKVESIGDQYWENTIKGNALSMATAAKPITRAKATQKLKEFLERVKKVNEDDYFLFRVKKVVLFGSYLSLKESVNDIDIAIELVRKITDDKTYQDLANDRIEQAYQKGRTFRNFFDQMIWPEIEVRKYLKARSRVFSLHDTKELSLLGCESKLIYNDGILIDS